MGTNGEMMRSVTIDNEAPIILGVQSFHSVSLIVQESKESGLPLLPRSVTILGRFELLRLLRHRHLTQYLSLHRDKDERIDMVVQIHAQTLSSYSGNDNYVDDLSVWFYQAVCALAFLHERGIVHRNLSPENIYFQKVSSSKKLVLQLAHYGLFFVSSGGQDVPFPIGKPQYLPPEVFLQEVPSGDPRSDFWMLAAVFLEAALGAAWLPIKKPGDIVQYLLDLLNSGKHPMDNVGDTNLSEDFLAVLRRCLEPDVRKRPTAAELLAGCCMESVPAADYQPNEISQMTFAISGEQELRSNLLKPLCADQVDEPLMMRTPQEVHHWWSLAGGEAVKSSEKRVTPSVVGLPCLAGAEGSIRRGGGALRPRKPIYHDVTKVVDTKELHVRVRGFKYEIFYPLLSRKEEEEQLAINKQPKVIKERDLEYQMRRCIVFSRLIGGYPYTRSALWAAARVDVPPLRRIEVWAALLQVEGSAVDLQRRYDRIDKESVGPADAQISIDLPRCHQYEPRLASPAGHSALRRVLKAWVFHNSDQYVYWQGVDSLLAPFLYLGLAGEALAFACLERTVDKYLKGVFRADNMDVLEEYMRVYMQLLGFHEPQLAAHLDQLNLQPTQYALPWFFTLFSHKFPLEETVRLWDSLFLGNSSFPLCIAVAIWRQLKEEHDALQLDQTECWALIKDLPVLDTERLIRDAIRVFRMTPKSTTYRHRSSPPNEVVPSPPEFPVEYARLSLVPSISLDDLQELGSKAVVLDYRSPEDFLRGAYVGSVNLTADDVLDPLHRNMFKVVVATDAQQAVEAANRLVCSGARWCAVLTGGAATLRQASLLAVPTP